jgi:hypothetical protein
MADKVRIRVRCPNATREKWDAIHTELNASVGERVSMQQFTKALLAVADGHMDELEEKVTQTRGGRERRR